MTRKEEVYFSDTPFLKAVKESKEGMTREIGGLTDGNNNEI